MKFFGKELKFNNNKVYHAGDKPTPNEIGAAAASHGTHVTWATTAPKANGTAAVGTVARVAREDHVHPLQTSVSGNAGTATVWQNARTLTVGNTGKSVNGSANVSWSLNEIGAAPGKTVSATTAATAQWYRIATSPAGISRCIGNFTIEATVSGKHSATNLIAGVNYGVNPTIQQLAHSDYSSAGITKARIVYHTTYNNNYAYLEVYIPTATATTLNVSAVNLVGWSLVTPNTVGSIPSGYTSKEITLVNNKIVANIQGSVSGSASSATKAIQDSAGQQINTTYIKGLSVSGRVITYTKGDGTTGTITTQDTDTNTTYTANTGIKLNGTTFQHTNAVTAGTAQGDANKTLTWGGTFTIPTVTYDAQGHITGKGTTTMTMPANPNSDTKVTNTLNTTAKAYITGTTSASTNTGTQVFDTGVYLDTTAGMLTATTFKGALSGNASTATKLATARTIKIGNTSRTFDGTGNITWTAADIGVASINDSTTATGSVWSSSKTQTQINTSYNTMTKRVEALEETMYSDFVSKSGDTMTGDLTIKKPDGSASKIKVFRTISSKEMEASMDIYNYDGGSAAINTWDRTSGTQMANYVFGGIALFAADVPSGKRPELGLSNYRFEKAWLNKLDIKDALYTSGTITNQGGTTYLSSTVLANNHSLYGKKTDGTSLINICGVDTSNNIYLGWGNESYIDVNNTMRTSRDLHVMNGAAMRVTGHLNVARTTAYTQLATFQTAGDSNAQGDGQTHIGYFNSGWGGYTHYFRGGGPVIIDNLSSLQITKDWFRLGGKYVYLRSATPSSGLQVGDIWIQI